MKDQLITEITRQMLPYLDNSQMEQLQEVLSHCFWDVQVSIVPEAEQSRSSHERKKPMWNCWICLFLLNV